MDSEQVALDLIGLIYDAASDARLWPRVLERLGDVLGATSMSLFLQDQRKGCVDPLATTGLDPAYYDSYVAHYGALNLPLLRAAPHFQPGGIYLACQSCERTELVRSEFYNDWVLPQGMEDAAFGVILREDSVSGIINPVRPRGAPDFAERDLHILRMLMPHLRRAIQLHQRITGLAAQTKAVSDALDHWPLGVILLNADSKVALFNRAAKSILDQRDGLTVLPDGLHAATSQHTRTLRALIHGAIQTKICQVQPGNSTSLQPDPYHPGGSLALPRPSGKRPLSLLVAPACGNEQLFPEASAAAIVFVSDPERTPEPETQQLQRFYHLSPAEVRVAALLLAAKRLPEISGELGISLNTVKTHTRRVFEKTGTCRQSEFIRLVLQSPVMVHGGRDNHPMG